LPIGVRALETMTASGISGSRRWLRVGTDR
jgi:hypothetical protein